MSPKSKEEKEGDSPQITVSGTCWVFDQKTEKWVHSSQGGAPLLPQGPPLGNTTISSNHNKSEKKKRKGNASKNLSN